MGQWLKRPVFGPGGHDEDALGSGVCQESTCGHGMGRETGHEEDLPIEEGGEGRGLWTPAWGVLREQSPAGSCPLSQGPQVTHSGL